MPEHKLSELSDPELRSVYHRASAEFTSAIEPLEKSTFYGFALLDHGVASQRVAKAASEVEAIVAEIRGRSKAHSDLVTEYHEAVRHLRDLPQIELATLKANNFSFYNALCRQDFRQAHNWGSEFLRLAENAEQFGDEAARSVARITPYIRHILKEIDDLPPE